MQKKNARQFIVVKITDDDDTMIVGTYKDEDTAQKSAGMSGHILDIEFEVEESVYGKGVVER